MQVPYHPNKTEPAVPIEQFGKDHWSTFAYVECRCVDNKGLLHRPHLRIDADHNPQMAHGTNVMACGDKKYPTRLKDGELLHDHDDWDCIEDLEAVGLVEIHGTGINPILKMTRKGNEVAAQLRAHKAAGGSFSGFDVHNLEAASSRPSAGGVPPTVSLRATLGGRVNSMENTGFGPCDDCDEPATWYQPGIPGWKSCHACYVKRLESIGCRYVEHDHVCARGMRGCNVDHPDGEG